MYFVCFSGHGNICSSCDSEDRGGPKREKSALPLMRPGEEREKASCKINRKHYFPPAHAAVLKCHEGFCFEKLPLSQQGRAPDPLCHFYFMAGETQLLNYPLFMVTLNLQLILASANLTSETATIPELSPCIPSPSVGTQLCRRAFLSSIAFQPFLWNSFPFLSK